METTTHTKPAIETYLSLQESIENRANEIALRMKQINHQVRYNPNESVEISIYGIEGHTHIEHTGCDGYTGMSFPTEYLWTENWEEKYIDYLSNEKKKSESLQRIEALKKEAEEKELLKKLKDKYPNA